MHVLALLSSLLIFSTSLALAEECKPPKVNQALQDKIQAYVDENVEPLLFGDEATLEKLRSMGSEAAAVADRVERFAKLSIIQPSDAKAYIENTESLTGMDLNEYVFMLYEFRLKDYKSKEIYKEAYEMLSTFNKETCLLDESGFFYAGASLKYYLLENTYYSDIDRTKYTRWMAMSANDPAYEGLYRKFLNDIPTFMINMEIEYWREQNNPSLCKNYKGRPNCTEEIIGAVGEYRRRSGPEYKFSEEYLHVDSTCNTMFYFGDSYMKIDICGRGD